MTRIVIGVVALNALISCVSAHAIVVPSFYWCGEPAVPFLDEQGREVSQLSNLIINRITSTAQRDRETIDIFYLGKRSLATSLFQEGDTFKYQFSGLNDQLFEVSSSETEGQLSLISMGETPEDTTCTKVMTQLDAVI